MINKSDKYQKGFVGAPILIGFLIAGLGVVGAWYARIIQIPNFPPPGCYYQKVQCIKAPCNPILICDTPKSSLVITSPTPISDETANWKTYTDTTNGYLIKYPSEWNLSKWNWGGDIKEAILLTTYPIEMREGQYYGFHLTIYGNKDQLSSRQYFDRMVEGQKGSGCEGNIRTSSNIPDTLKDYDATIAEGLCGIFFEGPQMYISKGDVVFVLSSSFKDRVTENDRNLVYKILSTFKFL